MRSWPAPWPPLDADKLYSGLDLARQKREVVVPDSTVLSLPYLLDTLVPQLATAADSNPIT